MPPREVVVTGLGAVAPNGVGAESFWEAICEGRSGVAPIESFDTSDFDVTFAASPAAFDPSDVFDQREQKRLDRFSQFGIAAAEEALKHAGLSPDKDSFDPLRTGVYLASGVGGILTMEEQVERMLERGPGRVSPFLIPKMITNMASAHVAIRNNLQGPNKAIVTACASAAHAIGDATRLIERGEADVMVAGGAEAAVSRLGIAGFSSLKALSTRDEDPEAASRPFDCDRDGFVLGEGAGCLILESREHAEARRAPVYAVVAGYGQNCDAFHVTAPREDARLTAACMEQALEDASLTPSEVDYVNAHGTSTPMNDRLETLAIHQAFGSHAHDLKISSTKSTTGHLLGAAAGIESVACVLAIDRGMIPPTVNLDHPGPDCDLDYVPHRKEKKDVRVSLCNSFGFGGHNACLVFIKA